tara:strand:+ start:1130 stop:1717 length:588 start_codon:yes stop_codon:yes gene_type:complete
MIVKLNVGGHVFLTTESTLTSCGMNMLSAMIGHSNPAQLVDGHFFIDRDPETFRWILSYFRGSKVLPRKDSNEIALLREEAEYFALDELTNRIQHMVYPSFSKGDPVLVRGHKFTIIDVSESGYKVTRVGKCFQISSSENVERCTIDIGDVVMAYHKVKHKRIPGVCMGIVGKKYVIQFQGEEGQEDCLQSGIRF